MSEVAYQQFLDQLVGARLLIPSGVLGVYGRAHVFEDICERVDACVTRIGAHDGAERIRFPPVVTRKNFERSDYLSSFPDMAGIIHAFDGGDREHRALLDQLAKGENWSADFPPSELVMTPAACYPIYPTLTGTLPPEGKRFDVLSYCFRHEPSIDPARMQLFRQREHVRVGPPESARVRPEETCIKVATWSRPCGLF